MHSIGFPVAVVLLPVEDRVEALDFAAAIAAASEPTVEPAYELAVGPGVE